MSITALFVLLTLAAAVALWAHHARISNLAIRYAQQRCQQQGLQLLDQSIVLEKVRFGLYRGMPSFIRRYRFEFSSRGDRRYTGWITLNAWRLVSTELEPFAESNALSDSQTD